jgi:hypothetical protein
MRMAAVCRVLMSAVMACAVGCGGPLQVDGSTGFAVQPVVDFRFGLAGKDRPSAPGQATRNIAFRIFAKTAGFSGKADAMVEDIPPESTAGDLSFFFARAGLEMAKTREKWESFMRIGLLGHSYQRYDTVVGGTPESFRSGRGDSGIAVLSLGVGVGLTMRQTEGLALTVEGYCNADQFWLYEVCIGAEFRASRSLSFLVGYMQRRTDDMTAGDSSGRDVEALFTSRCLATGVVCRF